jgi:type IV pilus assembly protein PilW
MQENARFALNLLRNELQHGDFIANTINGADSVAVPGGLNNLPDCADAGGNAWLFQLGIAADRLFYINNVPSQTAAQGAYNCIGAFQAGTDILAVQRLLASPSDPTKLPATPDNRVYVRVNANEAKLFHYTGAAAIPTGMSNAMDWPFVARIYYVNNQSQLVRANLTNGAPPSMVNEVLVDGIEQFHIEFGIDTVNDGVANFYTPDPAAADIPDVVTARIFVLARSPNAERDLRPLNKTYQLGSQLVNAFNDAFHRRVYTTTVMVRNFSYHRGLGVR